jgi:uncharacterized Zn finger protein
MRWDREFFPRSQPRAARGGIKAQNKRGDFGSSWWAKRWIAVLESFNIGGRLQRGRSYARQGQVLSIDVAAGEVTAAVQGSRPQPYQVSIAVKTLSDAEWAKLLRTLAGQARYAAKLLAGEMPHDIEEVFQKAGLSLFPTKRGDLKTDCSCPDMSNPCKHIAAVYYLLGEEFDRDPFLLFQLRGLGRDELSQGLASATGTDKAPEPKEEETVAAPADPVPADPKAFWIGGALPDDLFGDVQRPPVSAAWPKRLGGFPFWRGTERFLDAVEPVYREAAEVGLDTFRGERVG